MTKSAWIFLVVVFLVGLMGIYWYEDEIKAPPKQPAGIANPASVNCVNQGGTLEIVDENNGAVGYCHLKDGRVCEEWSLMRGGCMAPGQVSTDASSSVQE